MKTPLTFVLVFLFFICQGQDENTCFTEEEVRYVWMDQPDEDKRTVLEALSVCPYNKDKAASMIFLLHQYLLTPSEEDQRMIESLFILQTPLTTKEMKTFCSQLDHSLTTDSLSAIQSLRLYTLLALLQTQQKTIDIASPYLIKYRRSILEKSETPPGAATDSIFALPLNEFEEYCQSVLLYYSKAGIDKNYLSALLQYKSAEVDYNCRHRNLLVLYLAIDPKLFEDHYAERMNLIELY